MLDGVEEGFQPSSQSPPVAVACQTPECRAAVPLPLATERTCLLHFTENVERACAKMRRETTAGPVSEEYREKAARSITDYGVLLARVATSDVTVPDPVKKRVLSTMLTLMILREILSRAVPKLVRLSTRSRVPAA